jgi:COP9 signalosome complex subunit 6
VPLNYTIESGEAEMIGMDFVAKGAGNASSVPNTASATPQPEAPAKDTKGKEKEKEAEKTEKQDKTLDASTTTKVDVGTQNDELISNLTAKKNAITMLNSRIKLLLSYLQDPPDGVPNHQILREIQSLTHSRLPLLKPANQRAFVQEKLAEESDVNLVILLGAVTRSIEEVRGVGRKSAGIDQMLKSAKKGGGGPPFEDAMDFASIGGGGGPPSGARRLRGIMGNFGF